MTRPAGALPTLMFGTVLVSLLIGPHEGADRPRALAQRGKASPVPV